MTTEQKIPAVDLPRLVRQSQFRCASCAEQYIGEPILRNGCKLCADCRNAPLYTVEEIEQMTMQTQQTTSGPLPARDGSVTITATPEHGVGEQEMTFRMAANAIWNKLNISMALVREDGQLMELLSEARALANSIVHHPRSGSQNSYADEKTTDNETIPDFSDNEILLLRQLLNVFSPFLQNPLNKMGKP